MEQKNYPYTSTTMVIGCITRDKNRDIEIFGAKDNRLPESTTNLSMLIFVVSNQSV